MTNTSLKKQFLAVTDGGTPLARDQFESRAEYRRYMRETIHPYDSATRAANRKAAGRALLKRQGRSAPNSLRVAAMNASTKLSRISILKSNDKLKRRAARGQ